MTNNIIELRKLTKTYGKSRGVTDINLQVTGGNVFGFLGPNGAGKSTTINMLLDFIRPTSGQIKLFNTDIKNNAVDTRRRIGFLAGDMALDNSLTGWRQLEYLGNLRGSFDRKYVSELAKRLDCRLERKFKALSRGNKQKVGLIAALMHKPELLILDEPTSGLDPLIQSEFNKLLIEHKNSGGTAFISSHVLSEVQEICDTVAFIREGQIKAIRSMAEITNESPKDFMLTTNSKDLKRRLSKLSGVTIMSEDGNSIQGIFSGDVNELIRLISGYSIENFTLSDAELEAVFMKYYEGDK